MHQKNNACRSLITIQNEELKTNWQHICTFEAESDKFITWAKEFQNQFDTLGNGSLSVKYVEERIKLVKVCCV